MSENIINDGDFDPSDFHRWTLSDANLVTNPAEQNNYCHIEATASIMQDLSYVKNTQYVFSFNSRGSDGGTVEIMDPTTGQIFLTEVFPSSDNWHYNQFSVTTDNTWTNYVALHFQATQHAALDIDNVTMQPL